MSTEQREIITETDSDGNEADFELTAERADDSSGEGTLIENVVDALFDDGKGEMTEVYADNDGDGRIDIAVADTDGDGNVDMALVDSDGDGLLDTGVADLDGDGTVDMVAADTDGDGLLDTAVADTDGDGEVDIVRADSDGDGEFETVEPIEGGSGEEDPEAQSGLPTEEELSMNSVEFNLGSEAFTDEVPATDGADPFYAGDLGTVEPEIPYSGDTYSVETESMSDTAGDPAIADQQAKADAAGEAQIAADEFAEAGDYSAAADARAEAETLSGEAGDSSMLGAYDAQDLQYAADKQDQAAEFRELQAEKLAEGDYEGARQAAFESEWATRDADMSAGGTDHTGQAQTDQANLEWASYHQEIADDNARNAEVYAAEGDFDKAEMFADQAVGSEAVAGDFGEKADPTDIMYETDHSSMVETGGAYDAGSYDASIASVDTGFDAQVDTAPSSFDTSTDDVA